jgi:hypothetical protein
MAFSRHIVDESFVRGGLLQKRGGFEGKRNVFGSWASVGMFARYPCEYPQSGINVVGFILFVPTTSHIHSSSEHTGHSSEHAGVQRPWQMPSRIETCFVPCGCHGWRNVLTLCAKECDSAFPFIFSHLVLFFVLSGTMAARKANSPMIGGNSTAS